MATWIGDVAFPDGKIYLSEGEIMNSSGNDLIKSWAHGWTSGDSVQWLSLFSDDCLYEDVAYGSTYRGRAELRVFIDEMRAAFPDLNVRIHTNLATDRFGSAEWEMSGTHLGDLPGMPAQGRTFRIRGASMFEFVSGKIHRCSDYWDQGTLLKQLGFAPDEQAA